MNPNAEKMRQYFIERFDENIKAHLEGNFELILADRAEDYWVISEGEIKHPTLNEQRMSFRKYLKNTKFHEYSRLMTPDIEFSDDMKTAWGKYRVKVIGETSNSDGSKTMLDFVCAWLWVFKHVDGQWLRVGEVSTWR